MRISDWSSDVCSSDLRERHATLARTAESGAGKIVHDGIEIGVGHDNAVVLGATHRLHALAVFGPAPIDVMRDIRTADDADSADRRMIEDRIDPSLVSVSDLQHPLSAHALPPHIRR